MNFFHVKRASRRQDNIIPNPLLKSRIIDWTLKYLSVKDLLSCRLVNKLWRKQATQFLQGKVIIRLNDLHSIDQFNRVLTTHLRSFPNSMFKCVELGLHAFVGDSNVQAALAKLGPMTKSLVLNTTMGPADWRWLLTEAFVNVQELEFCGLVPSQPIIGAQIGKSFEEGVNGGGVQSFEGSITEPVPGTSRSMLFSPNLGRPKGIASLVKITLNIKNRRSEDIFVRRFMRDIFALAPNLQHLEWVKEDRFGNDFQKTMFDCLMTKTPPGGLSKLAVLNCPSLCCGGKELRDLTVRLFPLKEIQIQISNDVSAQCLEAFLEGHGATLEIVKLEFSPGTPLNININSPPTKMIKIREMSLTEYRRSIGFVGHLPTLKKLILIRTSIKRALVSVGWSSGLKGQTELSLALEQLHVYNDYLSRDQGNCTREIVLKLAQCFPNLKVIRMEGLDDSSIRHLLKSFEKLEELYAPAGTYSDEAFRSTTNVSGRSPNRLSLSAFDASHLKYLRTLELESMGLSDKFVTQGIIQWTSLRNLTIKYSKISFRVLSRILTEMELHKLRLEYCTILTEDIIGLPDIPVEMLNEDDTIEMDISTIQKWRYDTFRLMFMQVV